MSRQPTQEQAPLQSPYKIPRDLQKWDEYYRTGEIIAENLPMDSMLDKVTRDYGVDTERVRQKFFLAFPVDTDPSIADYTIKKVLVREQIPGTTAKEKLTREVPYIRIQSNANAVFERDGYKEIIHPWIALVPQDEDKKYLDLTQPSDEKNTKYILATWYDMAEVDPSPSEYRSAETNH